VLARTSLTVTPLSDIQATRRISIEEHIARLENDSTRTLICRSVVLLVAIGNDVLVELAFVG